MTAGEKYTIEVFLISREGFERKVSTKILELSENPKKWDTFSLIGDKEEKKYELFFESEFLKKVLLKPLGLKLPLKAIDNFFDEKLQLLNKSDLLNKIDSIVLLKGILFPLTKQNMGSRIIQKLLAKANESEVDATIQELKKNMFDMIPDRYGNYVVQKLFKISNFEQRNLLLASLLEEKRLPFLKELIKTKAGTHSLQSLLDFLQNSDI